MYVYFEDVEMNKTVNTGSSICLHRYNSKDIMKKQQT